MEIQMENMVKKKSSELESQNHKAHQVLVFCTLVVCCCFCTVETYRRTGNGGCGPVFYGGRMRSGRMKGQVSAASPQVMGDMFNDGVILVCLTRLRGG